MNSQYSGQQIENILTSVSGKYVKPSSGIPKNDLSNSIQNSLNKADSALQAHQDISGKIDEAPKDSRDYVRNNGSWIIPQYQVTYITSAVITLVRANSVNYRDDLW